MTYLGIMSLDEVRCASVTVEVLRGDIIRSAARGQGPTFIAAKLDRLLELAAVGSRLPGPSHAALSLAKSLPDSVVNSLRGDWANVAVIKKWRDDVLAEEASHEPPE
jgi:hypothetical protein